jgi:hypothetical protein
MSLFNSIKNIFRSPALIRAAKDSNFSEMAGLLSKESIFVISKDIGESISMQPQQKDALRIAEAAAMNRKFEGAHKYDYDGVHYLPIFTSRNAAEEFCAAYSGLIQKIHAYRVFEVSGSMLKYWISTGDVLVLNPQDSSEVRLNETDSAKVGALLTGVQNEIIGEMTVVLPLQG